VHSEGRESSAVLGLKQKQSGSLVVMSRTLIREDPGSIPGASYLGKGSMVVLHHQAHAGINPT